MSEAALPGSIEPAVRREPDLTGALNPITAILVGAVVASVPLSVAYSTYFDIAANGEKVKRCAPFLLRFVGLLVTLGFEFVSALHDVANEVASATYTSSLPAGFAVVWSGSYDLAGACGVVWRCGSRPSLFTSCRTRSAGRNARFRVSSVKLEFSRRAPDALPTGIAISTRAHRQMARRLGALSCKRRANSLCSGPARG
jgi:hypothetical protein